MLNRPSALRELLSASSEAEAGETYIHGAFEIEGDLVAAFELADLLAEHTAGWTHKIMLGALLSRLPRPGEDESGPAARLRGEKHSLRRDQEAIRFHYDVSNAFYSLWLDSRMVYSCAYFENEGDSLETAQLRKLDTICRKLDLKPGQRFLDIGSGWGALLIHAARNYGVKADGVTLSEKQFDHVTELIAKENLEDLVTVRLLDYREIPSAIPYDRIASVGMVEHVGTPMLPAYFQKAAELLVPGGLFLNHGIGLGPRLRRNESENFIQRFVFPDTDLQPIDQMLHAAEQSRLEIRDVESLREHYDKTLRHWVQRLESNREAAVREVGEKAYRIWRLYMTGSSHGFARGHLSVYQTLLAKPDDQGSVDMPLSRKAWYAKSATGGIPAVEWF